MIMNTHPVEMLNVIANAALHRPVFLRLPEYSSEMACADQEQGFALGTLKPAPLSPPNFFGSPNPSSSDLSEPARYLTFSSWGKSRMTWEMASRLSICQWPR